LWNATTGQLLRTLEEHSDWVLSVAVDLNGRIVSGSRDKTIRVWDRFEDATMEVRILKGHEDSVRSVHFSPDGSSIVSGSYDMTVRVWNTATGAVLHILQGHGHRVTSVRFNHNGGRIVSGGSDKVVRVWDMATSEVTEVASGVRFNEAWEGARPVKTLRE
jgi:WD40 repeat protein